MKKLIFLAIVFLLLPNITIADRSQNLKGQQCNDGEVMVGVDDKNIIICKDFRTLILDELDKDGDGHNSDAFGGDDCDDSNPLVYAGAEEICDDNIDNDCDGAIDTDDSDCVTGGCVDDSLEENDVLLAAIPQFVGSWSGLISASNDSDWFSFQVEAGYSINIDVYFAHIDGDIDIYLYDPSENLAESSVSSDDDENITYTVSEAGTYYLEVINFSESACTPYDIVVGLN